MAERVEGKVSETSKLRTIIGREFGERVRSRWFLIATILGPVFMGLMLFLPIIIGERERRSERGTVRVIDATPDSTGQLLVSALRGGITGDTSAAEWRHTATAADIKSAVDRASEDVLSGKLVGYLELNPRTVESGTIRYTGRNTTSLITMQTLERAAGRAILARKLSAAGIDADRSEALSGMRIRMETERLTSRGRGGSGRIGVLFALSISVTLYLTIFMHGANVMRGVLEEKQTRVAEVVLSSVKSDTLLMGKVLGIGAVGFLQLAIWMVIATAMLYLRGPVLARFGIQAQAFALPELSIAMAFIILLCFLLGFLFYAGLFAAVGAMVSTEQDAQQAQLPVVLLLVLSLAMVQGVITNPDGNVARLLTMIPFSAPIILPLRLSLAPVPDGELAISLTILGVSAIAATLMASRLYRTGVLMYGKPPSLKEAWRWMKEK